MYYVYVIKRDNKFYFGFSEDLKRRFKQHAKNYSCKMLYYEAYVIEKLARERESNLKQYGGVWRSLRKRLNIKRAG
jgi:predicted GIY-YIG superfamily endonuclease